MVSPKTSYLSCWKKPTGSIKVPSQTINPAPSATTTTTTTDAEETTAETTEPFNTGSDIHLAPKTTRGSPASPTSTNNAGSMRHGSLMARGWSCGWGCCGRRCPALRQGSRGRSQCCKFQDSLGVLVGPSAESGQWLKSLGSTWRYLAIGFNCSVHGVQNHGTILKSASGGSRDISVCIIYPILNVLSYIAP